MINLLEVTNVNKIMKGFQLNNISFSLEPGYIMGIIGPSGAGKTTLINILLGLYKMESGMVKICGYDLTEDGKAAKDCMGFVLDDNPFQEELSASQNSKIYGKFYSKWDQERFGKYMEIFEVNRRKPLKKLSKGTVIKFQLAFALSHGAKLIIMDEPMSGLDPVFRKELMELFSELIMDGEISILFSTHITEELDKIADYITFINNGSVEFSLSKEEILEKYQLIKGSKNQINVIQKRHIIGTRITEHSAEALVINGADIPNIPVERLRPTLEDILYYTINNTK